MVSQLHVFNSCSQRVVLVRVVPADSKYLQTQTTKYHVKGKVGMDSSCAKANAGVGYSQKSTYKGMDNTPGFVKIASKDFLRWDGSNFLLTVTHEDGTPICNNYNVPEDRSVIVKEDGIILSKYGSIYTGENGTHYY
ncbi:uncharacterized protein LOC144946295 [Lampetra fluviatilis]